LEKINSALTEQSICSVAVPEVISIVDVTTAKGNIERLATVRMNITLLDSVSGESVTITGIGAGQDSGDKAIMKAQTAAIKYAYLLSMAIATGDDPEADSKTDEASQKPPARSSNANSKKNQTTTTTSTPLPVVSAAPAVPNPDTSTVSTTSINNTPAPAVVLDTTPKVVPPQNTPTTGFTCDACGTAISEKVHDYAIDNFGRPLCYGCQRKQVAA
jgi:hypothetical protein